MSSGRPSEVWLPYAWERGTPVRLTFKLVMAFQLLLILLATTILLPIKQLMGELVVADIQNEVRAVAATAALQIDGDLHRSITAQTPTDDPDFVSLRDQLRAIMGVNNLTPDNIYTFYFAGKGELRFAVMPHPDGSEFVGDPYEAKLHLLRAVDTGRPQTSPLYRDEYGQWISAAAPILDGGGTPVGLIEVNRSFDEYADRYWAVIRWAIIYTVIGLSIATAIMVGIIHWVLIRPLRVLHGGMRALGEQRFDQKITLQTGDEFQDVGQTLQKLFSQLNAAKKVQQSFFPRSLPRREGLRIAGASEPCEAAGGDYFDAFELSGGRTAVLLADVSGHGLGSAMIMASCRAVVHALASSGYGPADLIDQLERILADDLADGRFITMIYGVIDADNRLTYANAGHAPAMVVTTPGPGAKPRTVQLTSHRPPVGIMIEPDGDRETTLQLHPGDRVLFTSDGVNEAQDPANRQFGTRRIELVIADRGLDADGVLDRLRRDLADHRATRPADDDVTMLCMDVTR